IYFSTLPLRAVIEALVLAGEAPTSIATHVGVSARAIEWYETAFFDVRDRLSAPAFIVHRVIAGAAAQSGSAPFMHVWKTAAYLGGASVLHVLLGIQKVDGLEQLLAHQRQQIRAGLQQQLLATASVLAADNPVAGARLLQLVDAGKGKAHEENSLNEFEENVRQMLAHLHFSVGEPEADDTSPLREFDACAAELRSGEQIRVAAGETLPNAEEIKSKTFPPPRRRNNGESSI